MSGTAETPVVDRPADTADAPDAEAAPEVLATEPPLPWWRSVQIELPVLAFLAMLTRLVAIDRPRGIVFDEVYFQEFSLHYLDGRFYFDIHPPLGKLLLGGWAALFGVPAGPDSPTQAEVVMRVLPALAGALLIVVFYLLLRELTASRKVATFAAALLLLDNAILVESRLILMDSMLLLFGIGALTCFLASRRHTGRTHWILFTAGALLAGMAVSVKWTGLAALGVIGLIWLAQVIRERRDWTLFLPQAGVLLVAPLAVYAGSFAAHFALLPRSGPGDAFMSPQFQATLAGNPAYDPSAQMPFFQKFLELNEAIRQADVGLATSTHPYSSEWLSWPLMQRGVYYWATGDANVDGQHIYLLGNPILWWGLLLGLVVVAVGWTRWPERFAAHHGVFGLLAVAWIANYLPFAPIVRPMFLYHYFFSFLIMIAAVSIGIGLLAGWMTDGERAWRFPSPWSLGVYVGLLAAVLVGFLLFVPITYGLPLDAGGLADRMWLSTWR